MSASALDAILPSNKGFISPGVVLCIAVDRPSMLLRNSTCKEWAFDIVICLSLQALPSLQEQAQLFKPGDLCSKYVQMKYL